MFLLFSCSCFELFWLHATGSDCMLHGGIEGVAVCVVCVGTKQPILFCLVALC
jgi:hypothetical protein